VGRHSERHIGSVIRARDVPDSKRSSRGGSRKEKKQVGYSSLSQSYLFVPIAAETMGPSAKTGWTFCAKLEGASHKAQMTAARAPSSFSDYPF